MAEKHAVEAAKELFLSGGGSKIEWSLLAYEQKYQYIEKIDGPVEAREEKLKRSELKKIEMKKMFEEGFRVVDICLRFDVGQAYVYRICEGVKRLNRSPNDRKNRFDLLERNKKIKAKFRAGKTRKELAKIYGLGYAAICGIVAEAYPKPRVSDELRFEILSRHEKKLRPCEIAREVNEPYYLVYSVVKGWL